MFKVKLLGLYFYSFIMVNKNTSYKVKRIIFSAAVRRLTRTEKKRRKTNGVNLSWGKSNGCDSFLLWLFHSFVVVFVVRSIALLKTVRSCAGAGLGPLVSVTFCVRRKLVVGISTNNRRA